MSDIKSDSTLTGKKLITQTKYDILTFDELCIQLARLVFRKRKEITCIIYDYYYFLHLNVDVEKFIPNCHYFINNAESKYSVNGKKNVPIKY